MSVLSSKFSDLPQGHIPKFVVMDLMYRDGNNYKTSESYSFENDERLSMAQLADWLENHMPTEEILASKHGLPNLAPLDCITDIGNDYDHCFMELTGFDVAETASSMSFDACDTPFSVVYHKTIASSSPEALEAAATAEQQNLIERLKNDTREVLTQYANVNEDELKSSLLALSTQMARACGMELVPAGTKTVKEGETVLPAHMDMQMVLTIVHSALNHTKTRAELVAHYGEAKVATLHTDFLRLVGATGRN
jgi:hypothetical protein